MTIQQDATPVWTNRAGEDSLASCAPICWLTAERQHCLFNVGRVRGHCIAFVRSAVEVTLSSGPSCCRQLGHATYIEPNYPCQLITLQLVPLHRTHTHTQNCLLYNECLSMFQCMCMYTQKSLNKRESEKTNQLKTIKSRTTRFKTIWGKRGKNYLGTDIIIRETALMWESQAL